MISIPIEMFAFLCIVTGLSVGMLIGLAYMESHK